MQGKLVALLVPALIVNYLSIARIVCETGLAYMRTTLTEQYAALYTIGTSALSPSSMSGISLTYSLVCQGKGTFMSPFMHVVRLADLIRRNRRRLVPALALVVVVGLAADFALTIFLGYRTGAFNFNAWPFSSAGRFAYDLTVTQMRSPFDTSWERLAVFCVGAAAMSLLTFLHYRLPWWPFHPIAFPIAFSWNTQLTFFSIFVVWAIKAILLKVGGVNLYRKWQPAFLGLLTGYVLAITLSFLVDADLVPRPGSRRTQLLGAMDGGHPSATEKKADDTSRRPFLFARFSGDAQGITRNTAELAALLAACWSSTITLNAHGPGVDPSISRVR